MQEGTASIMKETERLMLEDITALEKIDAIIDLYTRHIFLNEELALIFFQEQMQSRSLIVSQLLQRLTEWNKEVLERIIKEGQQQGLFSTLVDATFLYATILGTSQQVVVQNWQVASERKKGSLVVYLKMVVRKILVN
jgi:hypothetical protein